MTEALGVDNDLSVTFDARTIDDEPQLLERSYRLRYQVYCLERKFLGAVNYPQGLERDEFDPHSIHVGAVDGRGELAGTARAVQVSELGLPLFRHCTVFPAERERRPATTRLVEVGRLSVSRHYRRRATDDGYGVTTDAAADPARHRRVNRRLRDQVFPTVLKALYQATKRVGATHWLTAMEPSLEHLLSRLGFPFRLIGPQSDYLGLVSPYELDLQELDIVIGSGRFPALRGFFNGLERAVGPQPGGDGRAPGSNRPRARTVTDPAQSDTAVDHVDPPRFGPETEQLLLREFRRAAAGVPAYRALLDEHGTPIHDVHDFAAFSRSCPVLSHTNTFQRFPLEQLSIGGVVQDVAEVLTSSGHGGRFSFGVASWAQVSASAPFIDRAFDDAFNIASRTTLAINCLPMGVVFSSRQMTVATTSVREDMAVALVETFGRHYDQIVIVGDPLFLKKLTDHAADRRLDWTRYRVNALIGEEVFGEHFRGYLAAALGLSFARPERGHIMSSFGVGELGLHLGYETTATIGLRRALFNDPGLAQEVLGLGTDDGQPLPMIFSFNPLRTFIEVIEPDDHGYGRLTISMLDPERSVPLLRYQTGDLVRFLDRGQVTAVARRRGVPLGDLPATLFALRGRQRETLPNGSHVACYKDALYADHRVARQLTGAFRVTFSDRRCTMHVQLAPSAALNLADLEHGIRDAMPSRLRPESLVLWAYAQFPFGMGLDYERKFAYHGAPDHDAPSDAAVGGAHYR